MKKVITTRNKLPKLQTVSKDNSKTKQCKNIDEPNISSVKNNISNTSSLRKHNKITQNFNTIIKINQEQGIFLSQFLFFLVSEFFQLYLRGNRKLMFIIITEQSKNKFLFFIYVFRSAFI